MDAVAQRWRCAIKNGGAPLDTLPELGAGRRIKRLFFQCVNAGSKVNVKRSPIHHQSRNRLDPGSFRFFHSGFVCADL